MLCMLGSFFRFCVSEGLGWLLFSMLGGLGLLMLCKLGGLWSFSDALYVRRGRVS